MIKLIFLKIYKLKRQPLRNKLQNKKNLINNKKKQGKGLSLIRRKLKKEKNVLK